MVLMLEILRVMVIDQFLRVPPVALIKSNG